MHLKNVVVFILGPPLGHKEVVTSTNPPLNDFMMGLSITQTQLTTINFKLATSVGQSVKSVSSKDPTITLQYVSESPLQLLILLKIFH